MSFTSNPPPPSPTTRTPFTSLLLQTFLSDTTLQAGNVTFPAHKVILATRSPYFHAMFASGCQESSPSTTINLRTVTPATLQSTLEYIYTSHISTYTPTTLPAHLDLIRAADYFQMTDLHSYITTLIIEKHLSSSTALEILAFARQYRGVSTVLADSVKMWIRSQWDELVDQAEFNESMRNVESSVIAAVFE
ncbi:Kelch repeat and BTB domain-containing protein 2 [Rhizophlyctis rosea]|nr:Kelch repeat and BTB domain-containing protein 2 [Rhizophlyctis rosea]